MDTQENIAGGMADPQVAQPSIETPIDSGLLNEESNVVDSNLDSSELDNLGEASLTELKWLRVNRFGFSLCQEKCLVSEGVYSELLVDPVISQLPNSPPHFLGLTNVRGNLIPVYQLEPLLELPAIKPNFVFVLGELSQAAGLVIRGKPEPLPKNELIETDSVIAQSGLKGLLKESVRDSYQGQEQLWHNLDHRRLFTALASLGI